MMGVLRLPKDILHLIKEAFVGLVVFGWLEVDCGAEFLHELLLL